MASGSRVIQATKYVHGLQVRDFYWKPSPVERDFLDTTVINHWQYHSSVHALERQAATIQ